jgi:hypothetical protein
MPRTVAGCARSVAIAAAACVALLARTLTGGG